MRSIRISLILYFLLLLAAALGAVSYLLYHTTARALQAKQETNRELLRQQFEDRRHEESTRLDNALLGEARALATLAQSQYQGNRIPNSRFLFLGLMTNAPGPSSHISGLILLECARCPAYMGLAWRANTRINLDEDMLRHDEKGAADYLQINSDLGTVWKSKTLVAAPLEFHPAAFAASNPSAIDWRFDVTERDGQRLRRVVLKAPITRVRVAFPFLPGPPAGAPRRGAGGSRPTSQPPVLPTAPNDPAPPRQDRFSDQQSPPFFFLCAAKTDELDHAVAALDQEEAEQLRDLESESAATLQRLRFRLFGIALATFAAVCLGGSLLIGYGLMPLRRLSDAVSRVSEKDFRLHLEGPPPPRELEPIIERLQQTLELLRTAFDREKQATADISHELRTPLAGLLTTLEVTLKKSRNADEYRETLAECRDLVKQMTQLVERLLTLTRLDARSDRLRPEPVDAAALAEQCAALIRPLARASGLTFKLHHEAPIWITTDPDKLREVMANLMHNAVEYNRPSGAVDVYVRPAADGMDLEVCDTGVGIAPEHRERIFERFFRADPSRQADSMHAGLGLAIVRGYVELMGGDIRLVSETGRGSTFHVHIPSANNDRPVQHAAATLARLGA